MASKAEPTKTCTKCGQTKTLDQYSPNGNGYRSQCKECRKGTTNARTKATAKAKAPSKATGKIAAKPGTHTASHSHVTPETDLEAELDKMLNPAKNDPDSLLPPLRERGNGWNPGLKMSCEDGMEEGTVTTGAIPADGRDITWDDILLEWGLDPEMYQVVEPVTFNVWDAPSPTGPVKMRQAKGRVVKRTNSDNKQADVESLIKLLRSKKRTAIKPMSGNGAFVVALSDLQIGKGEGGGSAAIVGRIQHFFTATEERIKELRKLGRPINELVIMLPGDTVEGCSNDWYAMQSFQADLDNRQQVELAREVLTQAIERWSPYFERTRVVAVAGNHGERRKNGKAYTTFSDNADLEVVSGVAYAFRVAGRTDVEFILGYGDQPLYAIVDIAGWSWGMIHGHQANGGANPEQKVYNWYNRMAGQKQPIGFVDGLLTGHYHHHRSADLGGLYFIQAGSCDGGSEWFSSTGGGWSEPGLTTFAVYEDQKIADMQVLPVPAHLRVGPERVPLV